MKTIISLLTVCMLLLVGSSLARPTQGPDGSQQRVDPLLATAEIIGQLNRYENTDVWHRVFARQFVDRSVYNRKQIALVADVFQTKGAISKMEVRQAEDAPEQTFVEVRFSRSGSPSASNGQQFPLSVIVFSLAESGGARIVSIQLDGC